MHIYAFRANAQMLMMFELQATGSAEQPTVTTCGYRKQRQVVQTNQNYTNWYFSQ
jgi:hypothetical protein